MKGKPSTSEPVSKLLRRTLDVERREQLEREATDFFASKTSRSLKERAAYQKATRESLHRD
jgi:hypothetical protein